MSARVERLVIDRFEASRAVLVAEDETMLEVSRAQLPEGAREGAVLRVARDETGSIDWDRSRVDEEATEERLADAERGLRELRKRDPGGDVAL